MSRLSCGLMWPCVAAFAETTNLYKQGVFSAGDAFKAWRHLGSGKSWNRFSLVQLERDESEFARSCSLRFFYQTPGLENQRMAARRSSLSRHCLSSRTFWMLPLPKTVPRGLVVTFDI